MARHTYRRMVTNNFVSNLLKHIFLQLTYLSQAYCFEMKNVFKRIVIVPSGGILLDFIVQ